MTEPTIICPKCQTEIKLTESLAGPLIKATKRDFEQRLAKANEDSSKLEAKIHEREEALSKARESIEEKISERVRQERSKIASEESKKAKLAIATDLKQKSQEVTDLQEVLEQRDIKLAEAQKAQADLLRKKRDLEDEKREMDLTIEKRVQKGLSETRNQARKEVEDELNLKVSEKEQTILSMKTQIESLKQKAEQGSQQLQGEVLEIELELSLKQRFPSDSIEPVPRGEHGGDIIHVVNADGQSCGTILWELKRTKTWSDGWLVKLRNDQRLANAEIAVIASQTLPKSVETFELIDGVWVTSPKFALPIASILRRSLVELSIARTASEGQQTKQEMVYQYLTGNQFRRRVEAIVEAFSTMKEDLDKEKKAITKQWAKRETQIDHVMQATTGMYGDLQGIAGKTLGELDSASFAALEGRTD